MPVKPRQLATITSWPLAAALLMAAPLSYAEGLTDDLAAAIADSTVNLNFRYRFEAVDDDAFSKDAWANTLRSRLTLAPKPVSGFSVLVEVDDLRHIGADNFNDSRNGVTDRPGVTDPEGTDLNQALLRYTGFEGTEITVGRQRILRTNQRFIGNVGWRQNEQTYDAAGISHRFTDKINASYAFVGQVNRIQGPDNGTPPADLDSNTHLFDLSWTINPAISLAAYGYLMDFDNGDGLSNQTFGLRATGGTEVVTGWKGSYVVEFAQQDDYADNPVNYDAGYYLVEGGLSSERLGFKLGYEVLEGDSNAEQRVPHPAGHPARISGLGRQVHEHPEWRNRGPVCRGHRQGAGRRPDADLPRLQRRDGRRRLGHRGGRIGELGDRQALRRTAQGRHLRL